MVAGNMRMKLILIAIGLACFVSVVICGGSETHSVFSFLENDLVAAKSSPSPQPLMIPLTLIQGADSKGAGIILSLPYFNLLFISLFLSSSYFCFFGSHLYSFILQNLF